MINKRYRLARNFLILSIVAICTVFGYILSAYADPVSSITIHDVSLTLQNDANDNGMVNIGDQIKVDLVVSNTDGSCAANTTATADLTVYGGGTDEALSCITDNGGVADVMSVTFTVVDAGPMGIDVGADDETSQVNVATADNDDIPGPNDNSNLMAQPVDTIAPTVSTENIYVTGATGLNDTFKLGDTPIYIWDPSEESDDLAWVTMNVSSFMVGVTDLLAGLDEGVYKSQIFDALESQD
ncbi:hypothetical protein KKC87_02765, partial [Patescibacteria group bacterium]|nr:hypothetical protein [Patescibacteria group bacterium]